MTLPKSELTTFSLQRAKYLIYAVSCLKIYDHLKTAYKIIRTFGNGLGVVHGFSGRHALSFWSFVRSGKKSLQFTHVISM